MKREVRLFDQIESFAKGHWVTHALALTYGYDGDVAYDRIWKPLIERFGLPKPVVVADGVVDSGRQLGVKVLGAGGRSIFHPKLFVVLREDAALVAIGSANLTKGGLGGNLELLTSITFGTEFERSGSRNVLEGVISFLETVVRPRLHVTDESIEAFDTTCRALQIVAGQLPVRAKTAGPAFVHSGSEPLLKQLRESHGDEVRSAVVLSPFWEIDRASAEPADSTVHSIFDTFAWSKKPSSPRCRFIAGGLGGGLRLPKQAFEERREHLEVHLQAFSKEPRRLHAKLVALFGPKRTTVLWGSPNFTPSALLRSVPEGGNVECGFILSTDAKSLDEATLLAELDLGETFEKHSGELPEPVETTPEQSPAFILGELHYTPRGQVLSLHGYVVDSSIAKIEVRLTGEDTVILSKDVDRTGPFQVSGRANIERVEESGLRQLRASTARIDVIAHDGGVLQTYVVRPNVAFADALEVRGNHLLGAEAQSADALLVPPWSVPERRVAIVDARIEAMIASAQAGSRRGAGHQPSLDVFYKNVRRGLDTRRRELDAHRGSRFGLLRWSHAMRAALEKSLDGALDAPRLAYFLNRVSEHIVDVLDALPKWHSNPKDLNLVIEPHKLASALDAVRLDGALLEDFVRTAREAQSGAIRRLGELS